MSGRGPFETPTGDPCPRWVRVDGTVEGSGDCGACGTCLLFLDLAFGQVPSRDESGVPHIPGAASDA